MSVIMLPLKNLCLSLIAEEFERFHLANASNDANLKQNLEFLQRTYSSELASELFDRGKLKDEYLEFIINEHIKILNEHWLVKSRYKNCKHDLLCRLPNLIKLSCIKTNDEILENVVKFCSKIVEIDGEDSSVTDHGVNYLCKKENGSVPCPELKDICICSDTVTVKAVENLIRNFKSLEKIDHIKVPLALYSMHKDDLPKFEEMPRYNLTELVINNYDYDLRSMPYASLPYYNDLLKICLTVCPKLKYLMVTISDEEQVTFFNNPCLERVFISVDEEGPKINIDSFLKNCGRNLIDFGSNNCIMSISELAASCPKLKNLTINSATFPDDHDDLKIVFHSLVTCVFLERDDSLSDEAVRLFLLSSPNLEEVHFYYCDLSPDMNNSILKYCEKHILKSISFTQCILEESFVKSILLSCPSLKTMLIDGCPLIEEDELVGLAETLPNKPEIEVYDP